MGRCFILFVEFLWTTTSGLLLQIFHMWKSMLHFWLKIAHDYCGSHRDFVTLSLLAFMKLSMVSVWILRSKVVWRYISKRFIAQCKLGQLFQWCIFSLALNWIYGILWGNASLIKGSSSFYDTFFVRLYVILALEYFGDRACLTLKLSLGLVIFKRLSRFSFDLFLVDLRK